MHTRQKKSMPPFYIAKSNNKDKVDNDKNNLPNKLKIKVNKHTESNNCNNNLITSNNDKSNDALHSLERQNNASQEKNDNSDEKNLEDSKNNVIITYRKHLENERKKNQKKQNCLQHFINLFCCKVRKKIQHSTTEQKIVKVSKFNNNNQKSHNTL